MSKLFMTGSSFVDVFADFLVGSWKRNLEWRFFGSNFPHLRTSNTIVEVEDYKSVVPEPGVRLLKWSFGKSLDPNDLKFGYVIKASDSDFLHDPESSQTKMEWQYGGESCSGIFNSATSTAVLNFFLRTSTVSITYRILDPDTMAVAVMEVDEAQTPTIQYGNMLRIDESLYENSSSSS